MPPSVQSEKFGFPRDPWWGLGGGGQDLRYRLHLDHPRGNQLDLTAVDPQPRTTDRQHVLDPVGARAVQGDEHIAVVNWVSVEGSRVGRPCCSPHMDQQRPDAPLDLHSVEHSLVDLGEPPGQRHDTLLVEPGAAI